MKKAMLMLYTLLIGVASADSTPPPCSSDEHQAFDFWQGEWVVKTPDGSLAGNNSITKIQNGCVLRESWTSAKGGFTGTSLNFYHQQKEQWQQIWLDNSGGNLELKGNRVGNQMILQSEKATNDKGNSYFHRITWTLNEDGTVRQLWETITGENITVAFDGLYTKR